MIAATMASVKAESSVFDEIDTGIGGRTAQMVAECIAVHDAGGHYFFGNQSEAVHSVDHVVERASLRERYVAVHADGGFCAVHIRLFGEIHFGEIVGSLPHAEQFRFQKAHGGVAPTGAGPVLIFYGGNRIGFYGGEDEAFFLRFLFLFLSEGTDAYQSDRDEQC